MPPRSRVSSLSLLGLLMVAVSATACAGASDDSAAGAEPELNAHSSALASGDFAMLESAGAQLSPFGCRHYANLHIGAGSAVTLSYRLDSADPSYMDADGSCGGEELPRNDGTDYPLSFVERTSCGASVYEGTIKWTESGKVTRTMRLTDSRTSACKSAEARLVAEIRSTYEGETHPITTYYSVDPRP
jgi:hypothetical protein